MRSVAIGIGAVFVVGLLVYLLIGDGEEVGHQPLSTSASKRGSNSEPTLGSGSNANRDTVDAIAKFNARKADGLVRLSTELGERIRSCVPPSSALPEMRTVSVSLAWDDRLSTPELQRFVVVGTTLADVNAPVGAESRQCLGKLEGATLNVLLPMRELPPSARQFDEPISLPLP